MPSAEAPTSGRVISKVARASAPRDFLPSRPRCSLRSSFSSPPSRYSTGIRQSSRTTSAVCEARMPSFVSFLPWRGRGCPCGTTKDAWPRVPSAGSTVATTTWTSAIPPLVMKTLVPFRTHSSPSRLRGGLEALDVGAGLRLGDRVGAELDLLADAEALRDPAGDLLGGAGGGDAGGGEAGAGDRERDAGAAPVELLGGDHLHLALGVGGGALDRLETPETLPARLLDDLPGDALVLVVLGAAGRITSRANSRQRSL